MNKIRFIHTGDIHLGSLLKIGGESLPPFIEKTLGTATMVGFKRICDTAIAEDVDFMVISGDLYDREVRSVKAMAFFVDECQRLEDSGIEVFVIAGNHDPLREKQDLFKMPENVKFFPGDYPKTYEVLDKSGRPKARVIGQSYQNRAESRGIFADYGMPDDGLWNIALLHTQLESGNFDYVPCSLGELKAMSHIHYWALGHIHKFQILSESRPIVAYSGIPQGRDFGETGRGGCLLVEFDPVGGGSYTHIPIAPVIYKRIVVDINKDIEEPPESLQDLEEMIYRRGVKILGAGIEAMDYPIDGYVVEWVLKGYGAIHDQLKEQEQESLELLNRRLRSRLGDGHPFIWTESIVLGTQPPLDYNELIRNSPILGEVNRVTNMCLKDEALRSELIKSFGDIWSHKGDHEDTDDFRFFMDDVTLKEVLDRAKQLIIEDLIKRGDGI